jgi:hypothetical protein
MAALDAADVAPGRHFLAPKAWRVRRQIDREALGVEPASRPRTRIPRAT